MAFNRLIMPTAKIFVNGRSQAVRLPKEFQFEGEKEFMQKVGDAFLLVHKNKVWNAFLDDLDGFTDDFLKDGRIDLPEPDRDSF